MKIVITQGCTAFSTVVDDVNVSDMSPYEFNKFIDKLLSILKLHILEQSVSVDRVIECFQYDEYKHDPHQCDQCGDTVSTTEWNL